MRQVVQHIRSGKTHIVEAPVPYPGRGRILVRTAASVISSGTERTLVEFSNRSLLGKARSRPDLVRQTLDKARREGVLSAAEAVQSRLDEALPLGYSSAGTVVEVGEGVEGFAPGDRVACAGGGFAVHADYAVVPRNLVARLPESVGWEAGAFATLGAIALHALHLGGSGPGDNVAVIGLGLIGQLACGVARASGCRVFGVDLSRDRVELARRQGAEAAIREEAEAAGSRASRGLGFDSVLICADSSSNDPIQLAAELARDTATIVAVGAVGLEVPRKAFYEKELRLIVSRSYGPGRYDSAYEEGGQDYPIGEVRWTEGRNLQAVVELFAKAKLDVQPFISHRFPVEEAEAAYAALSQGALSVVLTYPEGGLDGADLADRSLTVSASPPGVGSLRLGVLGAGNYAMHVALPIVRRLAGVQRAAVASPSGLRAAEAARRFGFSYATSDSARILADDQIDAVAILTRHHLHAELTARALRAGKHVWCEKPLALDAVGVAEVEAALRESNKLLMVGFNRRFAPMAVAMKEFLRRGGGPWTGSYRVNAGPLPSGHWLLDPRQGGGRILGEGCHFVDFFTFLFDSLPWRVQTSGLAEAGEHAVLIRIEFENGSLGTVEYSGHGDRAVSKERLEVSGSGYSAVLDDFRTLTLAEAGRRRTRRSWLRQDKGNRAAWEAFRDAIGRGGPPPIPYDQVFRVARATIAASESLHAGRALEIQPPSAN
ncbi:MAG: bi-domain-containing oxidoreductase [Anaerolineales bacterium]